jgi:hypothetical protein
MIISNQRIRLAIDTSQMGIINDVLTGATPQFWNGVDLQFELAIFYGSVLAAVSNLDSITVDLKAGDPRTGLPLMSQTVASGSLNNALTLEAWNGGAPTDCHALVVFTNAETNLDLGDDTDTFWLVISAITSDNPSHKLVLGATPLNVTEGGEGVEPPASVVSPTYYTAAQSDARYTLSVDLTTINSGIATLNSEMTAVTATANAALPLAGGTLTGALTITGLSGVLKAPSGVVTGGATTSDLTEGTNLYWTQARFNTALAAVSGAASGVCPLDSTTHIPATYLPSITVHNTFVVSSQSAMLALAANQGDVAVRTDLNESFILAATPANTLGNWTQLLTPASSVTSVNSLSGTVTLTTTNIAEGANLYFTTARANAAALATPLTGFSNATGGNVTSGDTILIALGRLENRVALDDAKADGGNRVLRAGDTMTGTLQFSGSANAGVILSNLTDTQRAALTPAAGMMIYDTTLSQIMTYNGSWQALALGTGTSWFRGTGAPGSGRGANGSYYIDTATGNLYLKTSGAWAVIYSPTVSTALPTAGGTMTGALTFNSGVDPAINFSPNYSIGAAAALLFNYNGTPVMELSNDGIQVTGEITFSGNLIAGSAILVDSSGNVLLNGNAPASSSASGIAGRIQWDANYIYICTATATWKRAALSTF